MNSSLEKNLSQYSPIGAWFVIALDKWVYNKFKWPNCYSQGPPLVFEGSREFRLLLSKSRKFFPLESDTWKSIFYCESIVLYSVFL